MENIEWNKKYSMAAFIIAGREYMAVSMSFFNPLIALINLKIRITLKTLNILTT